MRITKKDNPDEYNFQKYVSWLKRQIKAKHPRWREMEKHLRYVIAARVSGRI